MTRNGNNKKMHKRKRKMRSKKRGPGEPLRGGSKGGARRWGAQKGGGPKGGDLKAGARSFALFFPSPAPIFALLLSLWCSSRGILVVFEAPGPSNVHVESSQAVV